MATQPKSQFDDVKPWPKAAEPNERAVIGHNHPPLEERIPVEFRQALVAERADFLIKLDDLLGKVDGDPEDPADLGAVHRARCDSEDTLGKCGALVKSLRAAEQLVDGVHKELKQPYLDGGRLVDAEKNALIARIGVGKRRVQGMMDAYADEQLKARRAQEAKDAEERARLAALARENDLQGALPPPPPPPAPPPPVRSDFGATVSLGTDHVSTVTDYAKAFKKVKDIAAVREAIDKAIQKLVRDAKGKIEIPGVTITERAKTSAR